MRVDLKGNQAQRRERRRLHDWHVIRCLYCWTSYVRSGAGADVGHTFSNLLPDCRQKIEVVERFQKSEGVTATDENCFSIVDSGDRIDRRVNSLKFQTHFLRASSSLSGIGIAIE